MGIRERLDDARILWAANRKESAFLLILCAADATATIRYPDEESVGKRFRRYILDEMGTVTGGPKYNVVFPFRGKQVPLEEIMYSFLRCSLVHDAEVSDMIVLTEPTIQDGKVGNVIDFKDPFGFPINFAWNLWMAVWSSPENKSVCMTTLDNAAEVARVTAIVERLAEYYPPDIREGQNRRPANS